MRYTCGMCSCMELIRGSGEVVCVCACVRVCVCACVAAQ